MRTGLRLDIKQNFTAERPVRPGSFSKAFRWPCKRHLADYKRVNRSRFQKCRFAGVKTFSDADRECTRIGSLSDANDSQGYSQWNEQATWQDSYTPSDEEESPGPIPGHLLESNGSGPAHRVGRGSITQHMDMGGYEEDKEQPEASTSGRFDSTTTSNGSLADNAASNVLWAQTQPGNTRVSRVRFWLQFHAQFGQRMRIVGSHEALGSWKVSQGRELEWSSGDKWNTVIEIPAGSIVEYKFVLLEGDGVTASAWQQGNNNVLAVGHADDNLEVFETWESGPGAEVIAAGEKTTREGRMLSWANEVESLFAAQRSELRKARMELAEAQEEARVAREEARQFRAELKTSRAELTKAEMSVRELTVNNRVLKTQLDSTTLSFKQCLETTQKFLNEALEQTSAGDEAGENGTGRKSKTAGSKRVSRKRKTKEESPAAVPESADVPESAETILATETNDDSAADSSVQPEPQHESESNGSEVPSSDDHKVEHQLVSGKDESAETSK